VIVWNTNSRTAPCPQRRENGRLLEGKITPNPGDEDEEVLAELEGPPMKKVAMAEAVATA